MNKLRWIKNVWLVLAVFIPILSYASSAKITEIHLATDDKSTRLLITLDHAAPRHVFTLANPDRLVMDFEETRLKKKLKEINIDNTVIEAIRSGSPKPKTLRIVLDMKSHIHFKVISNPDDPNVVVEVLSSYKSTHKVLEPVVTKTENNSAAKKTTTIPPAAQAELERLLTSEQPQAPIVPPIPPVLPEPRPIVVIIDPGHGGKDPGTIGGMGTKEKDVVLAISKQLANLINEQPDMRAVLTRKNDRFITLRTRLKRARKGKGDLFIAIHADSYFNDSSTGVSVYALSQRGATCEAARWLARRDNYSELGSLDLGELGDQSYLLRSVLIDLAQTATITVSLRLGSSMLETLDGVTHLHYPHVEQAPFVVLKSPDIPSILVETGFLSNKSEEMHLRDKEYQMKIAQALFDGIRLYIKKYSPVGA